MVQPFTRAHSWRSAMLAVSIAGLSLAPAGCRSAADYRAQADDVADQIIEAKQTEGLGRTQPFTIDSPADTLRRRLMLRQDLPHRSPAGRNVHDVEPIDRWPDPDYFRTEIEAEVDASLSLPEPVVLTLNEALQVAAANSRTYQTQKENVYRSALALDLERHAFRLTFAGLLEGLVESDLRGDQTVTGVEGTAIGSASQTMQTGAAITSRIAVDLVRLLTQDRSSSMGLQFDASVSIPLLRGAGRFIVTEPLTQAEREAVYAIWNFERFKRTFAVSIASQYLGVLQQWDQVDNAEENYRGLVIAGRRARRLAEAGFLPELQVDQAAQDELRARSRWISARESFNSQLDNFKSTLGLPPDAHLTLERNELEQLVQLIERRLAPAREALAVAATDEETDDDGSMPLDAPIDLVEPDPTAGGPYEIEETRAIALALNHRLDLWIAEGEIVDAQRQVAVAADGFLPELTLFGSGQFGARRGINSANQPDARLRPERGVYTALLELDLPLDRTAERNIYRNVLIEFERRVRDYQAQEDEVKLDVRSALRTLLESREGVSIQAQAVALAERRVDSADLFLQAGRAEIRDLLEAQEALVVARNALTAAMVNYRVAELEIQRDIGLLEVDSNGLWREFDPQSLNEDDPNQAEG
ncbi:TolC family protein [Phycisphaerales bacterium AB-hyl4]|uniref:TolC family protein n=1 Tax=Natronomicrosphaera hydrolytica TaxID=3242702 RepID=A0ABV4U6P9_9BACT